MTEIQVGRLLRASIRGCVAGCQASQIFPDFGAMVVIPLKGDIRIFGLVTDIHIDDDGLVRQLAAADNVPDEIIQDNRLNRNMPVEMSVIFIGHARGGEISHQLPPQPPLSLDSLLTCGADLARAFTRAGRFGYLRHILSADEVATADLLAAHLAQAGGAHAAAGDMSWLTDAIREVITLLRDDHELLTAVLGAIADILPAPAADDEGAF